MSVYSKIERIYIIAEWMEYGAKTFFLLSCAYLCICAGKYLWSHKK